MKYCVVVFWLLFLYCHAALAQTDIKKDKQVDYSSFLNQQGFIKNAGQFFDENNNAAQHVLYGTHIGNCGIFITDNGLSYINYQLKEKTVVQANANRAKDSSLHYRYDIERTDIILKNAQINAARAEEIVNNNNSTVYNYYTTYNKTGSTGLHSCKASIFKNVYPGIDWAVQFMQDENGKPALKYNFIVHPGANINSIQLQYSKNTQLQLNKTGDIVAQTALTHFIEKAPVSYTLERHEPVYFRYSLRRQTVSFTGVQNQFKETVVIDPDVFWATYFSSTQPDVVYQEISGADVATDANSNILVTLSTAGSIPFLTANPGNGAYYQDYEQTTGSAMIVMKFIPGGQLTWSTYFSGKAQTRGILMTVDKNGNVFAAGRVLYGNTVDFDHPYTDLPLKDNGGYFETKPPSDNFITKFDNDGRLLWCSLYGGVDTYAQDITTDEQGNLYITGEANNPYFPLIDPGNGAYMQSPVQGSTQFVFINQFDAANKLVWSTHIDGEAYNNLARIDVDKTGNIYIGSTEEVSSSLLKDAGGYFSNDPDGFSIMRFNKNRQITWCTNVPARFGLHDLTVDENNNLYVINGVGMLRKFDEHTALVWTQAYTQSKGYFYHRIVYNKHNKLIHILGQMNDDIFGFPTKNTTCNGSFFFDGHFPKYPNSTTPIFMTYTTDGELQYCSLADWYNDDYQNCNFTADANGDLIYLFKTLHWGLEDPAVTNPGNGAYYNSNPNKQGISPLLMKLKTTTLTVTSKLIASSSCDCNNAVSLDVLCGKAPFTYEWSNGAITPSVNLCAGDYWVKVTDADFLTKILYINIPNPTGSVNTFSTTLQNTHCDKKDGSIAVDNIQGGSSPYLFSFNNQTFITSPAFRNIDSGNYVVTVKDAKGCMVKDTFAIGYVAGPSAIQTTITPTSCNQQDGIIKVDNITGGTAPYRYGINDKAYSTDPVFDHLSESSATVFVQDSAGCVFSASVKVAAVQPPQAAQLSIQPDHCASGIGSISIDSITGGTAPFFTSLDSIAYTSQMHFNQLDSGTYTLYIKDSKSCLLKREISLSTVAGPDAIHYHTQDAACGSTTGVILIDSVSRGILPYTFSVDNDNYQSDPQFNNLPYGDFSLTAKDNFGCTTSEKVTIAFVRQYGIDILPHDTIVCYGEKVPLTLQFENPSSIQSVHWNTSNSGNRAIVAPLQSMPVTVFVSDKNGCTITDTAYIQVKACNTAEKCVSVPSAFTPNQDGLNDELGPVTNGCLIQHLLFQIYNRFGQLMFTSSTIGNKWDGTINNVAQPQGTYTYLCSFTTVDGIYNLQGTLVLIR